jgi:serine/threonine-protein kinase
MGAVLRGHDPDLGRDLAVKVLLPQRQHDPAAVSRFTGEAQIGGQLQHPGIVPVYEVGRSADERPYFTMKLVKGRTLAALLRERPDPRQDLPRFEQIFVQVCQTMAYAHSRGVIHRDLKPSNVMVGAFGEVQVMDWGLAKVLGRAGACARPGWCTGPFPWGQDQVPEGEVRGREPAGTPTPPAAAGSPGPPVRTTRSVGSGPASEPGHVLGTPSYMAPEQAAGEVARLDERCDVFGLGAILCEILTGQPPYVGADDVEILRKAMRADLAEAFARLDACGAVPELIRLAKSSLAAAAAQRPRDAGVLAAELVAYRESVEARLRQAELAQAEVRARAKEERKRRGVTVALVGSVLLTVLLVGGGLFLVVRAREARETQARDALAQAQTSWDRARAGYDPSEWAEARAMARQAEALLEQGPGLSELADQARSLLSAMDQEQADRWLLARLERSRLRQAAINVKENRFAVENLLPEYRQAFHRFGLRAETMAPPEAAALLRRRPVAVRGTLVGALDHWLVQARHAKAPEVDWLERVLSLADSDPWRRRLRAAWARGDRQTLEQLAREVDAAAQPPEELMLLDRALHNRDAKEGAAALLRRAQDAFPKDFWINHDLGIALRDCRPPQYEDAIRFLTVAAALRPDSAGVRLNLGLVLEVKGRLDEAAAAFRKAIALEPAYAMAHECLGRVFHRKGQLDAALAKYREAIRLDQDNAFAYADLGFLWQQKGQPDRAIACFQKAIRLKDLAQAHHGLGNIWRKQKQYGAAIAAYREGLRRGPYDAEAHINLGLALEDGGRPRQAIAAFRKAIALNPTLPQAHYLLARALQEEGHLDEAVDAFRRAVALQMPNLPQVHTELGIALAQKGWLYEAVGAFREAIRLRPGYAPAHCSLGVAFGRLGELDGAISSCREAIRLQPALAGAHNTLGFALTKKGCLGEAIPAYRRAIRFQPHYPEAHRNLGLALAEKGLLEEAVASYREAIRQSPRYAMAYCDLGLALQEQGKFGEALASLRRGHRLGAQAGGWSHPSAQWLRQCERWIELERRLPGIRQGKAKPANVAEQLQFAWLCSAKQFYAAAARLYADAFAAGGAQGEERKAANRYNAACCAARAGCGQGKDARLNETERARWRGQAREWLRADLLRHTQRLASGSPVARAKIRQTMQRWLADAHLAGVRGVEAISKLPAEEREGWAKLWTEAEALRKRALEKAK